MGELFLTKITFTKLFYTALSFESFYASMSSLVSLITTQLMQSIHTAIESSERAHKTATDKENIPENKYDTLALEAAYLAHGQSMRIQKLQQALLTYQQAKFKVYDSQDEIGLGALVSLELDDSSVNNYFIGPSAGGLSVEFNGCIVQVLTPDAPLGAMLMSKMLDDEVTLTIQGKTTSYNIVEIQ